MTEIWTFQVAEDAGYYTMHDGTVLVPDAQHRVTTSTPAHAATLRLLGATEVQQAPEEAAPAAPAPDAESASDTPEPAAPAQTPPGSDTGAGTD